MADATLDKPALATAGETPLPKRRGAIGKLLRNRSALIGGTMVLLFLLMAVLAPILPLADPLKSNFLAIRKPPSELYWFGTDELGRDQVSRLFYGAQTSLLAGGVSVMIALAIGLPFGLLAGWYGGWIDIAISRVTEAMLACPFLILAIAFAAILGPSLTNAMIAIGLSAVPIFIRLVRGQVMSVKAEDFVEGARSVGARDLRIMVVHVLPNTTSPIVVQSTLFMAQAIILEASLSFLGLGQQPPSPSWGQMLNVAKNFMEQAPWMSVAPGIAIFLAVLGFNLLGDGLRDALDPKDN
ncbi:ABC transporter permease [Bosea sp. PAMC 26642]|uniref:ABC transporter permease n=1 Tax=Bosea sp. (strain PAMC 26642) TaxID=1792307 RepID=UPI00077043D8|nr:ABC transporter permease [Bosea sp. PAMC 26642]AMJ59161.1 diguanylate cyclase [Bosea sp. PAMC 26642]